MLKLIIGTCTLKPLINHPKAKPKENKYSNILMTYILIFSFIHTHFSHVQIKVQSVADSKDIRCIALTQGLQVRVSVSSQTFGEKSSWKDFEEIRFYVN